MTRNQKVYLSIFFYCLAFLLIRVLSSNTLNSDEAEQFINSFDFDWGYSSQPPLFTWLLIIFNKIFVNAALSINVLKYILIYLFVLYFYKVCLRLINPDLAGTATFSLLLFPAYSYEIHRDLTHTTLLAFLSVFCFYYFLKISEEPSYLNYSIFGLSISLGVLSKYNIGILIVPLFLSALFFDKYRSALLNKKILVSIFITVTTLLPHIIWLTQHHFSSVSHAVHKSRLGGEGIESYADLGSFIFGYFPSFTIAFAVLYIVFFRNFKKKVDAFLFAIFITCFTTPILVIFVFHGSYFNYRWLVPIFFLIPLLMFSSIEGDYAKPKKILIIICSLVLTGTFIQRAIYNFFPDLVNKGIATNIPLEKVSSIFAQRYKINEKKTLIISHNRMLIANFKNFQPKLDYYWIEEFSSDYFISEDINRKKIRRHIFKTIQAYDQVFLLLDGKMNKIPGRYEKFFKKRLLLEEAISENYLHSKKFKYWLNPLVLQDYKIKS